MKQYRITYFIGQALEGLWRNGVMSFASIAILMSCLIVLGSFTLLVMNINENLERLGLMNEIVVFLDYDLSEEEIVSIENQIKSIDHIGNVERITADDGLTKMKEKAGEYGYLYDEYRSDNPLSDSFKITYVEGDKVTSISYSLRQIEGVRKIKDQIDLALTIQNFKSGVMLIFVWFLAVLFIVSVFVIINTVKLSVYSRKNEISIMRYVGATGWFISLPFVIEGALIGLIASIPAYFIEKALYSYVVDAMESTLSMLSSISEETIKLPMLIGFIAVGILTGIIGSTISLSKYTRN